VNLFDIEKEQNWSVSSGHRSSVKQIVTRLFSLPGGLRRKPVVGGGGGTPLYGLYRYVQPPRVGFFSRFGDK